MHEFSNLIAGQWKSAGEETFQTRNPARPTQIVGIYHPANAQLIDEAVASAGSAKRAWASVPAAERVNQVERYIASVEAATEELAASITAEQGKTLKEARAEVAKGCAEARYMLGHVMHGMGMQPLASARKNVHNFVMRRARGVIVAISPWNFPVMTPLRKIIPAIAYGNAAILKASEFTPAASCLLGRLSLDILPPGLLQVVHGGAAVGAHLVGHRGVNGVSFTGSVGVGKKILSATGNNLAATALELGGKNAAVVNDSDDLENCLQQITHAAFMCSGQRCTAISRVLVHASFKSEVVEGLARRAQALVTAEGTAAQADIGPITHAQQLAQIESMVAEGLSQGAKLVTGGQRLSPAGCEGGYFYAPTVLSDVRPWMNVAREEIFGPVISVIEYQDADEAFAILNDVDYGLTASLFSNDARLIARFMDECETGMLHVNHGTVPDSHMPFGGIKASGLGACSVGPGAAAFFTTEHAIYVGH